jgi:hypothetical protein
MMFLSISDASMSIWTMSGVRGEIVPLAGHPVGEARADCDQQVALMGRVVRGGGPCIPTIPRNRMSSYDMAVMPMRLVQDRDRGAARQLPQSLGRPEETTPPPA